ncbi:hypothetical protein [Trabulsiella odontotermitis]|nr:hypothetical protein [Trabulsiella odontotermitis]
MPNQEPLYKKKPPETELDRLMDELELTQEQRDFIESLRQDRDKYEDNDK